MSTQSNSIRAKLLAFFAQDGEDTLTVNDMALKWDAMEKHCNRTAREIFRQGFIGRVAEISPGGKMQYLYTKAAQKESA